MKVSFCLIAILLLGCISETYAADQLPSQTEFYPPSGKGRVIVVISGQLGPGEVAYYAKDIAAEGFMRF